MRRSRCSQAHPDVDLVITDQVMPKIVGSQLAAMIEKEWPDLPVVIATGYAELPPGVDRRQRSSPSPSRRPTSFGSLQMSALPIGLTPT